jgi:RNA polymerase sigma-70 factor (ECF subfamily)
MVAVQEGLVHSKQKGPAPMRNSLQDRTYSDEGSYWMKRTDLEKRQFPWHVPIREWSDENLLLAYRATGDRRLFEELIRRYERELFNYLKQYLGDTQLAEDAFQSTFLQIHLKCDQFDSERRFRPWLYAVATNQAIDTQRRRRRERMVSLDQATSSADQANQLKELVDAPADLPAEDLERDEERSLVRRAVEDLPEPLRQVLLLVYFQGLKYREAAEVLGVPVGTVKSRLHAAIRKLERTLRQHQLSTHV